MYISRQKEKVLGITYMMAEVLKTITHQAYGQLLRIVKFHDYQLEKWELLYKDSVFSADYFNYSFFFAAIQEKMCNFAAETE